MTYDACMDCSWNENYDFKMNSFHSFGYIESVKL